MDQQLQSVIANSIGAVSVLIVIYLIGRYVALPMVRELRGMRDEENKADQKRFEQMAEALPALTEALKVTREAYADALSQTKISQERYARLEKEVAELRPLHDEVKDMREQLEARDTKIAALEAEITKLRGQISTLEAENLRMEQELAQVKESREAVAQERDRLEARLAAVEKAQKPDIEAKKQDAEDKAA